MLLTTETCTWPLATPTQALFDCVHFPQQKTFCCQVQVNLGKAPTIGLACLPFIGLDQMFASQLPQTLMALALHLKKKKAGESYSMKAEQMAFEFFLNK